MTVDVSGVNLQAVRVPISGWSAVAAKGSYIPSKAELGSSSYTLPVDYKRLGLRTTDGAPEWAEAPSAPLETFEEGYDISAATGTCTVTQTFAQWDQTHEENLRGVTFSGGSVDIDVDAVVEMVLFTAVLYRLPDGTLELERRVAPNAKVTGVTTGKDTRGAITGTTVTWSVKRDAGIGNVHYRKAPFVASDAAPDPVITSVLPLGQSIGETVTILGSGFTGVTGITIDGATVVEFAFVSDGILSATIPSGVVDASAVVVTTPNGTNPAFSYTVAA